MARAEVAAAAAPAMALKPRQQQAKQAIADGYRRGVRRQLVALPTGVGKTVLGAHVARGFRRALFLVPREELLEQTVATFERVSPEKRVGVLWKRRQELDRDVVVGMVQTAHARLKSLPPDQFDLVIIDECFPAGTLIDGRPIEALRVGDLVLAYDEQTGRLSRREVTRLFRRPAPETLVRLAVGCREVVCTGNHPILTRRGWVSAEDLAPGDDVLCAYGEGHVNAATVPAVREAANGQRARAEALQGVRRAGQERARDGAVQSLRGGDGTDGQTPVEVEAARPGVLLGGVQCGCVGGDVERADGAHEPCSCQSADDGAQPHGACGGARAGVADAAEHGSPSASGGQWARSDGAATPAVRGAGLADGGAGGDGTAEGQRVPVGVQAGCRRAGSEDRRGGGRAVALCAGTPGGGQEEAALPVWCRVDGVEVLQRTGPDGSGDLCPDGLVYNIEVDGLHTYTANGIVVHNCHHAGARTWREVLDHLHPRLRLGLSATPERNDGTPLSNLFDEVVYQMTVAEAVNEGYLCRPVGLQVLTNVDISTVKVTAGDLNGKQLEEAIDILARNELIVRTWHQHAQGRRTIAFCAGVRHAQELAAVMVASGIRAEWVSGDDPDRATKIAELRRGQIDVLCNAMLLTEGFDDPSVSCILMARPTKSKPLYAQAVGRGLRLSPGKVDCLIVDFVDDFSRHSLATVWDWYGQRLREAPGKKIDLKARSEDKQMQLFEIAADRMREVLGCDLNLPVFARKVDLLQPPPDVSAMAYGDQRWHYDEPSEKQLAALERMGYDVEGQDWTKGQASIALGSAPATTSQSKLLLALGYDVLTQAWSRSQAAAVLDNVADKAPDWTLLDELRDGGGNGR